MSKEIIVSVHDDTNVDEIEFLYGKSNELIRCKNCKYYNYFEPHVDFEWGENHEPIDYKILTAPPFCSKQVFLEGIYDDWFCANAKKGFPTERGVGITGIDRYRMKLIDKRKAETVKKEKQNDRINVDVNYR